MQSADEHPPSVNVGPPIIVSPHVMRLPGLSQPALVTASLMAKPDPVRPS